MKKRKRVFNIAWLAAVYGISTSANKCGMKLNYLSIIYCQHRNGLIINDFTIAFITLFKPQ